jgi:hypothetical protein
MIAFADGTPQWCMVPHLITLQSHASTQFIEANPLQISASLNHLEVLDKFLKRLEQSLVAVFGV